VLSRRGTNQGTRSRWHRQRVQQPGNREDDINDDDDENRTRGENDPAFFEPRRTGLQPFTDGEKIRKAVRKQQTKKRKRNNFDFINHRDDDEDIYNTAEIDGDDIAKEEEAMRVRLEDIRVPIHGDSLGDKAEGTVRLIFENMNKLAPWQRSGWKIYKAKAMLKRAQGDFYLGAEVGANWAKVNKKSDLSTLFRTDVEAKSICGYNRYDGVDERSQHGGTAIIALDTAATKVQSSGTDVTGLGRWSWMLIVGKGVHRTRIISAYQPCKHAKNGGESSYAQHQ
jgi:hypothetical protein